MLTYAVKKNALSYQTARVFDLESLGIDVVRFGSKIRKTFDCLPWDPYELRGRQIVALRRHWADGSFDKRYDEELQGFLEGRCELSDLALFRKLESDKQRALQAMPLRRKRAVATFFLNNEKKGYWSIERRATEAFIQKNSTFYPYRRHFAEMESSVENEPDFQKILHFLPQLLDEQEIQARRLKIICHQVSLVATANTPGHGSPEGIHQDGVDFIVSALVVHRENISGGVSRIYRKSARGDYQLEYVHLLMPGQGLFHADYQTDIWHEVTPTILADGSSKGVRNSFGFDVSVLE